MTVLMPVCLMLPVCVHVCLCVCVSSQDLAHALHRHGASTLAHVDHLVWSFGVDPSKGALSDREYTAMMTELDSRREAVWGRLDAGKGRCMRATAHTYAHMCAREFRFRHCGRNGIS